MVERKLFKTKLCQLFKRGRCPRHNCSFAHGEAELRSFPGSFHGKRDFKECDLRDKLERRRSPRRTYSPVRDARDQDTVQASDYEPSRCPEKKRRHRKKQRLDSQSDISGCLRISYGAEHKAEEGKYSIQSADVLVDQLKQVRLDINRLDHQKSELQVELEGRVQEVESLTSKIQELETQLLTEKEDNQKILSKIKKFVMEHKCHSMIQDQLKRSEAQLCKLGDDLCSDINKFSANEENSSINIVSDEEASGLPVSSYNEKRNDVSQSIERQEGSCSLGESKQGKVRPETPIRPAKISRWSIPAGPSFDSKIEAVSNRNDQPSLEVKHRRKSNTTNILSPKKSSMKFNLPSKNLVSRLGLPPTCMAARAADNNEAEIGLEDNLLRNGTKSTNVEIGVRNEINALPLTLPPRPLVLETNYSMYEGDDENIDVDGTDD